MPKEQAVREFSNFLEQQSTWPVRVEMHQLCQVLMQTEEFATQVLAICPIEQRTVNGEMRATLFDHVFYPSSVAMSLINQGKELPQQLITHDDKPSRENELKRLIRLVCGVGEGNTFGRELFRRRNSNDREGLLARTFTVKSIWKDQATTESSKREAFEGTEEELKEKIFYSGNYIQENIASIFDIKPNDPHVHIVRLSLNKDDKAPEGELEMYLLIISKEKDKDTGEKLCESIAPFAAEYIAKPGIKLDAVSAQEQIPTGVLDPNPWYSRLMRGISLDGLLSCTPWGYDWQDVEGEPVKQQSSAPWYVQLSPASLCNSAARLTRLRFLRVTSPVVKVPLFAPANMLNLGAKYSVSAEGRFIIQQIGRPRETLTEAQLIYLSEECAQLCQESLFDARKKVYEKMINARRMWIIQDMNGHIHGVVIQKEKIVRLGKDGVNGKIGVECTATLIREDEHGSSGLLAALNQRGFWQTLVHENYGQPIDIVFTTRNPRVVGTTTTGMHTFPNLRFIKAIRTGRLLFELQALKECIGRKMSDKELVSITYLQKIVETIKENTGIEPGDLLCNIIKNVIAANKITEGQFNELKRETLAFTKKILKHADEYSYSMDHHLPGAQERYDKAVTGEDLDAALSVLKEYRATLGSEEEAQSWREYFIDMTGRAPTERETFFGTVEDHYPVAYQADFKHRISEVNEWAGDLKPGEACLISGQFTKFTPLSVMARDAGKVARRFGKRVGLL